LLFITLDAINVGGYDVALYKRKELVTKFRFPPIGEITPSNKQVAPIDVGIINELPQNCSKEGPILVIDD
jgi:hypothetical protein